MSPPRVQCGACGGIFPHALTGWWQTYQGRELAIDEDHGLFARWVPKLHCAPLCSRQCALEFLAAYLDNAPSVEPSVWVRPSAWLRGVQTATRPRAVAA